MGNDGGSIPDRRDLVRNKPKAEQADKHNQLIARWFFCALSKRPLQEPIVSCALGKLYNKDAILEYLLDKAAFGDGETICGHIRTLKDVKTLTLTRNPAVAVDASELERQARFACPLTLKEMIGLRAISGSMPPGSQVQTEAGAQQEQKDVCPQCAVKFTRSIDVVLLNPGPEEQLQMREKLEAHRAAQAAARPKKIKKRSLDGESSTLEPATKRAALESTSKSSRPTTPQPAPFTNNATATSRTVANALAHEELKRKNGMSEAVKSLYTSKNGVPKKETFMTRGTFTRYA